MRKKYILTIFIAISLAGSLRSEEFYGKIDIGYGALLQPDISDHGVRKGGFTAVFQGLFGQDKLKYGAEFGVMEAYTSWDKEKLVADKSLVLLPVLGALQYDLSGNNICPYLGLSAGPYFAVEHFNDGAGGNSSSGSSVYGGGCLNAGLRIKTGKKYDIDLSCRYSLINASENISMLGVYAGIGTKVSFFNNKKAENMPLTIKEKTQETR